MRYRYLALSDRTFRIASDGGVEQLEESGWWKYYCHAKHRNRRDIVKEIRRIAVDRKRGNTPRDMAGRAS
jgi:hypothetical protein